MGQLVSFRDFKQRLRGGCIYQAAVYYEVDDTSFTKTVKLLSKHEGAGTLLMCGIQTNTLHGIASRSVHTENTQNIHMHSPVKSNSSCQSSFLPALASVGGVGG